MKLLLTSAGFTNKAVINALHDLVEKPFDQLKLVFIPTAANVETGGKEWLIDDLYRTKKLGFKKIDIVDISALSKNETISRLETADILFFGGGDTYYLDSWVKKCELDKYLNDWINTKIYVGLSAGSMLACKWNSTILDTRFYDEKKYNVDVYKTLGFVDFYFMPHLNGDFKKVNLEEIEKLSKEIPDTIYALDDQSAIKVDGDKVEVVSEGVWKKFN